MNATEIETRLRNLISEAEISQRSIEAIYIDPIASVITWPFSTTTADGRRAIVIHPEDWEQLLNRIRSWLMPTAYSKDFFAGIPVLRLTDPAEAASLQPMIENDARIKDVFNVLHGAYLDFERAQDAARDVMRVLNMPQKVDWVGVTFKDFDSPSEAAAWTPGGFRKTYTYYAPQRMKLTIGDVVIVEDGSRPATVVELNAPHNANLVYKRVLKRDE